MSCPELEDLKKIESILGVNFDKEQTRFNGITDSTVESQSQLPVQDILHKKALTQDNIEMQNSEVTSTFLNNGNQIGGVNSCFEPLSPNSVADLEVISSFGTINQEDINDKWQFPQMLNLKPAMNSSVAVEENKSIQNNTGMLNSTDFSHQVSAINPLTPVPCTHIKDSSMSNEELMRIENAVENPTANIDPFIKYLEQNDKKMNDNAMSQQDMEDVFSFIANDYTGSTEVSECQNTQQVLSTDETLVQLFAQDNLTNNNIKDENTDVPSRILNTEKQIEGIQVGGQFMSSNLLTEQEAINSCSTFNWENKFKCSQITDLKSPMNSLVALEEAKPYHNNTDAMYSINFLPKVSAIDPVSIQVTEQRDMKIKTSKPGPIRNKVGRCSRDETPLYRLPEPENKQDKQRWRRAKTAHEDRVRKNTALNDSANKIKDLQKEMTELKNELKIVTAQRDAYKNTLDSFSIQNPIMSRNEQGDFTY